ncbi:cellulase family glycosylhydrolase [Cyanobacteria bacterium FACHB-472]|nr:cellulase family glycosylhydrolase [Cyanobacteria bacterium FACHB-472]
MANLLSRRQFLQAGNGLLAVAAATPLWNSPVLAQPARQPRRVRETLYTQGRYLYDRLGNKVIPRGVNKMSVWDDEDLTGNICFPEIRKTGANSVRIVWAIRKDLQPGPSDTDPNQLDTLITNAKANYLIPMIELHDATGDWSRLPDVIDYWTQPEVINIIQKHQEYLLVNIANEAGDNTVGEDQFIEGYSRAIQMMRSVGIQTPLVIDASDWGKSLDRLDATAARLIAVDPENNLLFSVHLYWSMFAGADANFIRSSLGNSVDLGYPLIVGEFSAYGGWAGFDENNLDENGEPKAKSMCSPDGAIDYQTIIEVCHQNEIGWYAWEWGPGNGFYDPLCVVMDMTPDRLFANLKSGWAEEVVISSPYSIKNTSITSPTM